MINRFSTNSDSSGKGGEFIIAGQAKLVEDSGVRELAAQLANDTAEDRYILFELDVESALSTVYNEEGEPVHQRWKRN